MARTLHVYPKAVLKDSEWLLIVKVYEPTTRVRSRFEHVVAAGVTAEIPLRLLKLSFDLIVADTDTDQDVDDALFIDDIRPGPQTETVWGNWQTTAEGIITGLDPGYTVADFWAGWSMGDTQAVRNDAQRALVEGPGGIGRGWEIVAGSVHQHEGDGTVTDG
jgi:hypothetical protein